MDDTLEQAARAAKTVTEAAERRDDLIRQAADEGASIRTIAHATGLTRSSVHRIITRQHGH